MNRITPYLVSLSLAIFITIALFVLDYKYDPSKSPDTIGITIMTATFYIGIISVALYLLYAIGYFLYAGILKIYKAI